MDPHIRFIASGIAVFVTLVWLAAFWRPTMNATQKTSLAILFALWTALPPVWFLYDWSNFHPTPTTSFEDFKYSQELARNLWIGIAALIGLLIGVGHSSGSGGGQ
jgi:hypothetical protein